MKKVTLTLLLMLICTSVLFKNAAAISARGTLTCPNCGGSARQRIIYREIHDVGEKHYAIFCYDQDCSDCGWNHLTGDYAAYRDHSDTPCALCGHTGDNCTQCR